MSNDGVKFPVVATAYLTHSSCSLLAHELLMVKEFEIAFQLTVPDRLVNRLT